MTSVLNVAAARDVMANAGVYPSITILSRSIISDRALRDMGRVAQKRRRLFVELWFYQYRTVVYRRFDRTNIIRVIVIPR